MTLILQNTDRDRGGAQSERFRRAFTLIEVLVVISIVALLLTIMGTAITTSLRKAREAATTALLQKIDGLLEERARNDGHQRLAAARR